MDVSVHPFVVIFFRKGLMGRDWGWNLRIPFLSEFSIFLRWKRGNRRCALVYFSGPWEIVLTLWQFLVFHFFLIARLTLPYPSSNISMIPYPNPTGSYLPDLTDYRCGILKSAKKNSGPLKHTSARRSFETHSWCSFYWKVILLNKQLQCWQYEPLLNLAFIILILLIFIVKEY